MASWIRARGKQWPLILFDNMGPEAVLCMAIYFRPCRHPAIGEVQIELWTSYAAWCQTKRRLEQDRWCGDCIDCKQPLIETYRFVRTYLHLLKLPQAAWIRCRAVVGQLGDHRAACARSRLLARRAACSHIRASMGSRRAGSRRRRRAGGPPTMAGADHRAGHSPR